MLLGVLVASACNGTTIFKSNFDATPSGQAPATVQEVGTVAVDASGGSVIVVDAPVLPSGKWVQVSRPNGSQSVAGLQGNFANQAGAGEYRFSTTVFMPAGSGAATIQFERFGQPLGDVSAFLHLDLLADDKVRFDDDDASKFGTFPRDKPFIVQVTLRITASTSTANVVLSGDGASGTADRTIAAPFQGMAQQFGAIRLWMGSPHTGSFSATNIVVKSLDD
jgi:hypothetical protein